MKRKMSVVLIFIMLLGPTLEERYGITVIGIMIFFSGLDIIGCFIQEWNFQSFASILHLEWWLEGFQFSSNTTCLFWVYNQAVPAWIATLLF